jgi:hypothetical protein
MGGRLNRQYWSWIERQVAAFFVRLALSLIVLLPLAGLVWVFGGFSDSGQVEQKKATLERWPAVVFGFGFPQTY